MSKLATLAKEILETCLPQVTITDADRAVIATHAPFLLGLEDELVTLFYDTVYGYAPTAAIFEEGERPAREATLREWWQRTITSGLDDNYLEWMCLVGIIHIRRKVQNPMMISMFQMIANAVHKAALQSLAPEAAEELRVAFSHVAATASALIADSYTKSYIGALENLAGLDPKLTARMLAIEVKELEAKARANT